MTKPGAKTYTCSIAATALLLPRIAFPAPGLDYTQAADLFSQAKNLFHQANELVSKNPEKARQLYLQSVMRLERIVRQGGIRNGKLYYNIGNVYFRMGDIGRAILYYRRAQRVIPNDPNLRQNLDYARTKRIDKIPEKQETRILKTLLFWHYDLSLKTRSLLFVVFFITLWTCASIRLFTQRPSIHWAIGVSAILAGLFFGSLAAEAITESRNVEGVILHSEVVARKGDGETYQPSFKEPLHAGTEFRLLEDRTDWYRVELPDGRNCWIPSKAAGLI